MRSRGIGQLIVLALVIGPACRNSSSPEGASPARPASGEVRRALAPNLVVSDETDVGDPVIGPAWGLSLYPRVAFDGTNYLVVWADERRTRGSFSSAPEQSTWAMAARVSPQGVILDPRGIQIAPSGGAIVHTTPAVAFDGSNYMVVWKRYNDTFTGFEIHATRISPSGLDEKLGPALAFDGTRYLVVWTQRDVVPPMSPVPDLALAGAFLTTSGSVSTPFQISRHATYAAIGYDGTHYQVVWARDSTSVSLVDPGGTVTSGGSFMRPYTRHPAIACGGAACLTTYDGVRAVRLDATGQTLDPPPGLLLSQSANNQNAPHIVFNGSEYMVVWSDDRIVSARPGLSAFAARIRPDLVALDPSGIAVSLQDLVPSANSGDPIESIGFGGTNYLLLYLRVMPPASPVAGGSVEDINNLSNLARAATAQEPITLFGSTRMIDFSQFLPRGHYVGNAALERYFRAMTWLSRIDFPLIQQERPGGQPRLALQSIKDALAFRSAMDGEAYERWGRIDMVLRAFVGEPDSMAPPDVDRLKADLGLTSDDLSQLSGEALARAILDGAYGRQRILSQIVALPPAQRCDLAARRDVPLLWSKVHVRFACLLERGLRPRARA